MNWAWGIKGLKPGEKLVLMKLADHANDDGLAWPGKSSIAEACEVSKRTADAYIQTLVDRNLLSIRRRKTADNDRMNDTNVYYLNLEQPELFTGADSALGQNLPQCKNDGGGSADFDKSSANSAPESSFNHQLEPPDKSSTAVEVLEYRTAKKKSLKGEVLVRFERFWAAFDHKHGKAAAADAWLEVECYHRAQPLDWLAPVLAAARAEAKAREHSTKAPKMAQGWLSERRWEDQAGTGPAGRPGPLPADLPWHATWSGILEEADRRGILYFEYSDPPNLITELIRRLQVAGEDVPGNLLRRLERAPEAAAA